MTGFRLPAEAVEAGAIALDGADFALCDDAVWDDVVHVALSAALPVLAEDPEVVERLAKADMENEEHTPFTWSEASERTRACHREHARKCLRDLFAAAPTDTTEESNGR